MSKYFASSSSKRGELHEWKEELHAREKQIQKEAVKKVIAAMTVGKDVSSLFPDVVQCMQSSSIELKKLVYLYIMNYAKVQPELAILAVNTFRKDASDPNPLIRALAVRTMGCIKLPAILEYLLEPLRRACVDSDPYVRKTAAVCVAKIHQMDSHVCRDQGLLDHLIDMISDANPVVVCNAIASLTEISDSILCLDETVLQRLLAALNEATEWGQVVILDALASAPLAPSSPSGAGVAAAAVIASQVLERVVPRLNHSNPAVVLSAVKVVLRFAPTATTTPTTTPFSLSKLAAPLISLMASEGETQYIGLRALNLISQRSPEILRTHAKTFFVKYNDPTYVKLEKLEVLVLLVDADTVELVLSELREYAAEVDMEFVRRAVRSIGKIAIKLNSAPIASRAVQVLYDLINGEGEARSHVLEEAAIVIRDIFRKYNLAFEAVLTTLCANLGMIEAPEGKAAVIFILGEYAEYIANADEIFMAYCEFFVYEYVSVQLALLTAAVKLFLKVPSKGQRVVTHVLKLCTEEASVGSVDLRERAFMYWRMLSTDPELTKAVVLGDKPLIKFENVLLDKDLVAKLLGQLGNVSSVVHKLPAQFLKRTEFSAVMNEAEGETEKERVARLEKLKVATERALRGEEEGDESSEYSGDGVGGYVHDLLDLDLSPVNREGRAEVGGGGNAVVPEVLVPELEVVVNRTSVGANKQIAGVEVTAAIYAGNTGEIKLLLQVGNYTTEQLHGFAIQFNKNFFGLSPVSSTIALSPLGEGETGQATVPVAFNPAQVAEKQPSLSLQVALKTSVDIYYFSVPMGVSVILRPHSFQADLHGHSMQAVSSSRHWSGEALGQCLSSVGLAYAGMDDTVALFGAKTVSGIPAAIRVHLGEPLRVEVATPNPLLTAFLHDVLTKALV